MSVADDIRLYPHFEIPSRLTSRLEDVHYRFALADTDEKLEKTLKVDSVSHGCLPKIYLVPTLLKLNTTSQPVIHKVVSLTDLPLTPGRRNMQPSLETSKIVQRLPANRRPLGPIPQPLPRPIRQKFQSNIPRRSPLTRVKPRPIWPSTSPRNLEAFAVCIKGILPYCHASRCSLEVRL